MLKLAETEVNETSRDTQLPCNVSWRDWSAVVAVDERERTVDKTCGRGKRLRRFALDETHVCKWFLVDLDIVSEQVLQCDYGAESFFLEVWLDAGEARSTARAETDVVVDAQDGDIVGNGEVGRLAGVENICRDEVAGRQHGRREGKSAEKGGKFMWSRRSATIQRRWRECLACVSSLG